MKRSGNALINLVDGLSSGLVVLVGMADGDLADHDAFVDVAIGDLADHDARLENGAVERLPGHDDHAQAIATTLLVVIRVLLDDNDFNDDQTLSRRTIDRAMM